MSGLALYSIEDYCANHKITERTYFRRKAQENSSLKLVYRNGEPLVMDLEEIEKIKTSPKLLKLLSAGIIDGFNQKIYQIAALKKIHNKTAGDIIADKTKAIAIQKEIIKEAADWNMKGVPVYGYTQRKLYEKIEKVMTNDFELNPEPLKRRERHDKHVKYNNALLAQPEIREKILMLAADLFFDDARGKIRPITVEIKEISKNSELFYELADNKALPRSTLADFLKKKFDSLGLNLKHELKNKYTQFVARQAYNEGGFYKDVKYMQWWAIDDRVDDISGVKVLDEATGKYVTAKVYTWKIIECHTLDVVAYAKKASPFNAQDIKTLLIEAFMLRGRPTRGILMDNGLAASSLCTEMLNFLGIVYDSGPAYSPLHKAVLERSWRFEKEEFNAKMKNYIGGGRKEVRHSTKKLSAEEAYMTFDEYLKAYDTYMRGWYRNKPRLFTNADHSKEEISIRDRYERCYKDFKMTFIPRKQLAYAAKMNKIKKMHSYQINMGKDLGCYNPGEFKGMNPVYDRRYYMCIYNPADTNIIDCYATESFTVEDTGEEVRKGKYVFSLEAQRHKGSEERQAAVTASNREFKKQVRKMGKSVAKSVITEKISVFTPELNKEGKYIDHREDVNKWSKELVNERMEDIKHVVGEKVEKLQQIKVYKTEEESKPIDVKALLKKHRLSN